MAANAPVPPVIPPVPPVIPPVPPVIVPGAPVFALTPAALMGNAAFIDYNSKEGNKAYERAIEPLDPPYDGSTKGLQMFIHQIKRKATICGWTNSILTIPIGNGNRPLSLLTQYGQITMQNLADHAATYMNNDCKAQQDATNLKICLDGSLDKDLMMRVLAQSDKYTINGQEHGPSMFRIILKIVGIETKATIAVINATLRTLPAKLVEVKNDIVAFNEYVTEQCHELTSRGQQPNDLLYLLFEAYLTCTNKIFVEYIRTKEAAVFDNSIVDMEPTQLMIIAEDKYKIMTLRGEWKATTSSSTSTTTDDHIVALQAAVQALTEQSARNGSNINKSSERNGKGKKVKTTNTGQWAWKDVAPKEGESLFKTVGGKEYVYCPHHATTKWVLAHKHKDGCTLDTNWKFPTKHDDAKAKDKKQLQYTNAMVGIASKQGYSSEEDEDENL
jgi:hypothetical protein